jgi:hypothetical protein
VISKLIPGFCFVDPTNKETVNIRLTSVNVIGETRRIRAVWTPELAQDLMGFHNIDAEAELTALITENLRNEIDQQILRDLHDNQRFYNNNRQEEIFNRWNQIGGNILIHQGNRAPMDNNQPDFGNVMLPIARRVAAQTMGLDLVAVQPLAAPTRGLLEFLDYNQYFTDSNYISLPNEEGWYTKGTFESLLISMDMKPFKFIPLNKRRRGPRRI